jgi:SAM-dependent methyltransferase
MTIYRERGPVETLTSVAYFLGRRVGLSFGEQGKYLAAKAQVDQQFDTRLKTDTGGVQNLFNLTITGANALHGGNHVAVDPAEFAQGINALALDPATFTFVDLGSGKGRALLLAAECGFSRVIGVEFALELHEVATANVAAFESANPHLANRIQLFHADATTFEMPPAPLVIFMFNPFDAVISRAVAKKVMASWTASPRPIRIFYMNPIQLDVWLEEGFHLAERARPYALLDPVAPPT